MKVSNLYDADDRAVSPVIGVILMVAITVILAAVIGTFVLGLGDQIGGSATAGVTVDGDNTTDVTITLTNSGTAESVEVVGSDGTNRSAPGLPLRNTGASATLNDSNVGSGDFRVVAVGPDGERSVLRTVTIESSSP
ncbi:type IV pilin N-terminal domain-containing protein [Halorubrum ezzemoulense]|uniref:type IV pilin N-terminal domain-containing protein n=1 Tax=Halorubrum ezzemoulense TaxID=337243 RepID=UPI00232BD027|nr:type IV pilin N-terminal domain-containing protein [Halorubrum ezzemoulense]MDB2273011.1 type IV pilin N-terminal domain-containing protein [Halorubrum ezzemoulense]